LLVCSSSDRLWMVWLLNGTGAPGGPPPRLEMLVLNLVVVCVTPLTVIVIWSPNMKYAWTELPVIWIRTMPPRTETAPVGV